MKQLLLLHGAIGSKDQFDLLVQDLEGEFELHSLNFSGHGGSAMPESFTLAAFAGEVIEYIQDHKLEAVNIFGYSMGGYVALEVCLRRPELVTKVFTLATKFQWTPEIAAKEAKMLNADTITQKLPAFADQLAARHYPNNWREVLEKTVHFLTELGNSGPLDFADIQQPVRVAIGDRDAMVTLEESIDAYRRLPAGSFVVLPQTFHQLERILVARLVAEIRDFFS